MHTQSLKVDGGSSPTTCIHYPILLSMGSTHLDDPAGVFSQVGQPLQLAQGCDRTGKGLQCRGGSAEGEEVALTAFKACGLHQQLQSLPQEGALGEGQGGQGTYPQPSSCRPHVPKAGTEQSRPISGRLESHRSLRGWRYGVRGVWDAGRHRAASTLGSAAPSWVQPPEDGQHTGHLEATGLVGQAAPRAKPFLGVTRAQGSAAD